MDQPMPGTGEESGTIATKRYDLGLVSKIEVTGPATLLLSRGARGSVSVQAKAEDHERIEVDADGDKLKLGFKGGMILNRGPESEIRYEVIAASGIEELKLDGKIAGEATGLEGKQIKVKLDGESRLSISDLRVTEFELEATGKSQATPSGAVEKQKVKVNGGASYHGIGLTSLEAEVDASGGSEASVRVGHQLKVRASGGSTVSYAGEGVKLDVKTDDGSNLRQIANA